MIGVPKFTVFENASYFYSFDLTQFSMEKNIKIKYSINYYPHRNGLAESTNKNLIKKLKRIVEYNHRN